ncbi:MAG: GNAT family N-acetyltransferase [Lachnospiraceae bacterium]|nr:GNAT family N-acetyltransferase [Lachnospiraceae bacterium]
MTVRSMRFEDYDAVYRLWKSIRGFGMRSIDDSAENIEAFIRRNPETCVVAEEAGEIAGAILCGHDGRRGCFYHVCVREESRRKGIGRQMVLFCIDALKKERINKVCLNAFVINEIGNAFWRSLGWTLRSDMNYYEFAINEANVTVFNE